MKSEQIHQSLPFALGLFVLLCFGAGLQAKEASKKLPPLPKDMLIGKKPGLPSSMELPELPKDLLESMGQIRPVDVNKFMLQKEKARTSRMGQLALSMYGVQLDRFEKLITEEMTMDEFVSAFPSNYNFDTQAELTIRFLSGGKDLSELQALASKKPEELSEAEAKARAEGLPWLYLYEDIKARHGLYWINKNAALGRNPGLATEGNVDPKVREAVANLLSHNPPDFSMTGSRDGQRVSYDSSGAGIAFSVTGENGETATFKSKNFHSFSREYPKIVDHYGLTPTGWSRNGEKLLTETLKASNPKPLDDVKVPDDLGVEGELPKIRVGAFGEDAADGIKIVRRQREGLAVDLGLQNGDIVTAVNGRRTRKGDHLWILLRAAWVSGSIEVEILRDGKPMTLKLAVSVG